MQALTGLRLSPAVLPAARDGLTCGCIHPVEQKQQLSRCRETLESELLVAMPAAQLAAVQSALLQDWNGTDSACSTGLSLLHSISCSCCRHAYEQQG